MTSNFIIPDHLVLYSTLAFATYSTVANVKFPCCHKCNIIAMQTLASNEYFYKIIGCKKCKREKPNIYSQEEFDKLIRYRTYLSELRKSNSVSCKTKLDDRKFCSSGHRLQISGFPQSYKDESWHCNLCSNTIDKNAKDILRCNKCGYDVCKSCQAPDVMRQEKTTVSND